MRALLLVLALTLASAGAALAAGECVTPCPTPTVQTTCPTPCPATCPPTATAEQVADTCIANALGLSADQVHQFRACGMTYADIAAAVALANRAGCQLSDVVATWQSTKSWSQTASKYNLTMSDIGFPLAVGSEENFNTMFLAQYYGVPPSTLTQLREQGFSWDEVYLIANASSRTGQTIQQIAAMRSQGKSWNDIACSCNWTLEQLVCPATPRQVVVRSPMGAGPPCQMVIYTSGGNALLTEDMANRFYDEGYDWIDVAIAANVSRVTGVPIRWFLERVRAGALWLDILTKFNVERRIAYNLTNYPFAQRSVYSRDTECCRLQQIQKWQQPCERTTPEYPVMTGRMPLASPSYNPPIP